MSEKWISIEDRLPNNINDVLVCLNGDYVYGVCYIGYYNRHRSGWYVYYSEDRKPVGWHKVTHWMPIPETPIVGGV